MERVAGSLAARKGVLVMATSESIRIIPATEVAKIIKTELRLAFPDVRLSVRTKWFGLYQSVVVSWKGRQPSRLEVRDTVDHLRGGQPDGLDGWQRTPIELPSGEKVLLGNLSIMYDNE
ncbi:MAG: hypothetical protein KDE19_05575 [Caldilineaceae bacterium]|nr:hypothetical protein [Caldilineaceae bacterium]